MSDWQESVDRFYWENGTCCAGCDHWQWHNAGIGHCTKAAPVSAGERLAITGIHSSSLQIGAGHPMTLRDDRCGDFVDTFDWSELPVGYLGKIMDRGQRRKLKPTQSKGTDT